MLLLMLVLVPMPMLLLHRDPSLQRLMAITKATRYWVPRPGCKTIRSHPKHANLVNYHPLERPRRANP
jgi:hypothetical protein